MAYKVVYEGPGSYGFYDDKGTITKLVPVGVETEVTNEEGRHLVSLSEQGVIRLRVVEAPKSAPAEVQAQVKAQRQASQQQSEEQG